MGITIETKEQRAEEKSKYPCFRVFRDTATVVYFIGPNEGTVFVGSHYNRLGEYSKQWDEPGTVPWFGTITTMVTPDDN